MSSLTSLVPVRATELALGRAAPWPIYNDAGELLLARGTVVETQVQLDALVANGLYRNANWVSEPDTESVPLPKARDVLRKKLGQGKRPLKPAASVRGAESVISADDIRWQIGDTLWLQPKEDASQRYAVSLVGSIAGKSILVSIPSKEGKQLFMRDGQPLVVRALAGKRAYAFAAQVLKTHLAPFPYLHVAWPREVRCTVIRQDMRVPVGAEGFLALGTANALPASVIDLSQSGASLVAPPLPGKVPAQKGGTGILRFVATVADQQLSLELPLVLRTVEVIDTDFVKYGAEFAQLGGRERLVLGAYVYQELILQE